MCVSRAQVTEDAEPVSEMSLAVDSWLETRGEGPRV